jgi:hypothetical protein
MEAWSGGMGLRVLHSGRPLDQRRSRRVGKCLRFFGAISPLSRRCFIVKRQAIIDAGIIQIIPGSPIATLNTNDLLSNILPNWIKAVPHEKRMMGQYIGGIFSCLITILTARVI